MASRKTELKKHLTYLESRRGGAEAVVGKTPKETLEFIVTLTRSIQDTKAELSVIDQKEADEKQQELDRRAELHEQFKVKS